MFSPVFCLAFDVAVFSEFCVAGWMLCSFHLGNIHNGSVPVLHLMAIIELNI